MDTQEKKYDREYIYPLLKKVLIGSLSTHDNGAIRSRYLVFACDAGLRNFYLITHKLTEKIGQIEKNPNAALCVLSTGEKLDDYSEIIASGSIRILSDFNDPAVQEGFKYLSEKSAMLSMMQKGGSLGDYKMLKLECSEIVFRVYRDILKNAPKTVIRNMP